MRFDPRPGASLALLAGVLIYVGCSSPSPPAPQQNAATSKAAETKSSSKLEKLVAALGKPAAIALISGELDGYTEPCGCSDDQEGGLIRRYEVVEHLRRQGWPVALFDLGGLVKDPAGARGGPEQAKLKFDYILKALALMKYDALALSTEDLKVGVGDALGLFDNSLGQSTKVVVANVQVDPAFAQVFRPSLVTTAGSVKIGVTSVLDPEQFNKVTDPGKEAFLPSIKDPAQVVPAVLADLESKSDFQILMVQGPPELARQLGQANPGFEIVVSTSPYDDVLNQEPEPINGDKTLLVTVGHKGKYVGIFAFDPAQTPKFRYRLVSLDKALEPKTSPMKALIQADFRSTLKAAGVVENYQRRGYINGAPGATFVGAVTCKECHPKTYEFWSGTKHAKAFDSLKHDPKPNVVHDADCVTCHTTGFGYESGWVSEAKTPYLAANQCENCHGPGSQHAAEPDNRQFLKFVKVTVEQADKNRLCLACHDQDNSPHFDFAKYWDDINHNGEDTYTDPKVHVGIKPKLAAGARPSTH